MNNQASQTPIGHSNLNAVEEKWIFELNEGNAINFNEPRMNSISTMKYNVKITLVLVFDSSIIKPLNFVPKILFDFFRRWQNVYVLIISIALTIIRVVHPYIKFYEPWIFLIPLGFSLIFYTGKEFYLDFIRWKSDQRINNQKTMKAFPNTNKIDVVKWKELEVGSIVFLKSSDICPADIILLDSSEVKEKKAFCMLDSSFYNGKTRLEKKIACSLTQLPLKNFQKREFHEYKKLLTGTLEYSGPFSSPNVFQGFLKIKKDPKVEQLSVDNFIPRGSIVVNTQWIYGLVVYTGLDTKIYLNSRYKKTKRSFLLYMSHVFFVYIWILMIACSMLIEIMFIPSTSDQTDKLFINMLAPIILFIPLLPFEIFFLHDIIWLGIKFKYEKQYLEHNFPNEFFHLTNPNVFSDFAHIEYAVLDKTGTLTESTPKISSLYFNGKFYSLEKSSNILPQTQKKNIIFTESFDKSIEKEISSKLDFENILRKDSNDYNLQFDSDSNFSSLLEQNLNNLAFLTSDCKFINKNLLENDNNHNSKQEDLTSNINKEKLIPYKKGPFINLKEVSGPKIHENNNEKNMNEIPLTNKIIFYNPSNKVLDEEYLKLPDKFDEETLINDAKTSPSKYFTLFEALVLCHYSFPRKDLKTLQTNYTSMDHESETVLRFCESCGFKFENSNRLENPDEYHINLNGVKNMKYRLLGIIDFSITRKIFSLIIQNPNTKQHILIVKGAEAAMCSKIQLTGSDEEKYRMIIKNFSNSGLTPIIYAFKILEEEEAKEFSKRILNLKSSLINQSDQLNELAEELEVNLNLMTILGLKEAMKPDAEELIEFFHSVNIKPWILTGDTKEKSLGAALNLNIITQENEPLMIESIMKEDLVIEIRNILSILKTNSQSYYNPFELEQEFDEKDKKIDKKKKKLINNINYQSSKHFLLINGPSLNLIEKDPYLYPHLAYICSLVKTVIGFNLSPWHKRLITRMIKKKFTRKPLVMAVGDGYNDVLMLQTADVGVEIVKNSNESKYEPVIMAGDIKISRLGQIKEVMTQDSLAHAEVLSDLIYYSGHKSILFGLPIFLFNFYNGFTSAIFQDSVLIFLYFFYFTKPLEIIYGLFYNRFDKKLLKQVPKLYIHGLFVRRKRQQKKLIIGVFLESIFSGILIFYLSIYVAKDSINENGLNNDLNMQALICFYACLIVQSCRMGIKLLRQINKKWGVLLCVGLLIMQAIFLVLEKMENVTGEYVTDNTKEVFSQFPIIMILILIVVLSLFFQMFMQFFFFQKWFPNPYDQVARYMDGRRNINLEKISDFLKEKIKKKINFSSLIKSIFKRPEWIDILIQQMLSPEDIDAHGMKLNNFSLKISDRRLEKKYNFTRKKKALKFSRSYYLLLIVTFAIYVIFNLIIHEINVSSYLKITIVIIGFLILSFMFTDLYNSLYYKCVILAYIISIFIKILFDWLVLDNNLVLSCALLIVVSTCSMNLNINILYVIVLNAIYLLNFIVRVIVLVVNNDDMLFSQSIGTTKENRSESDSGLIKFNIAVSFILLMWMISSISVYLNYKLDHQKRNEFMIAMQIELESNKVKDIFSILVPKFVRANMINGNLEMSEEYNNVSIIFCDIYNFDQMIATENERVVQILDNIYRFYDLLCQTYGVQKIETVGKTYMAATGIKICEVGLPQSVLKINKTSRLINMAFEMIKFIDGVTYGKNEKILIKIGIHVGKVIAGVIGYHKPQFSLIGDTVNTTSRVCSTGEYGAITLSNEAMIEGKSCDLHFLKKIVSAKGKGDLITWQVNKRTENQRIFKNTVKSIMSSLSETSPIKSRSPAKSSQSPPRKSFFGLNNLINPGSNHDIMKKVANVFQEVGGINSGNEKLLENIEDKENKEVNLEKNDNMSMHIDDKIDDDDDEDDTDYKSSDFKRIYASKYFLITPKVQNQLYDEFLYKLSKDYCKFDRRRVLILCLVYSIRTLMLVSLRKFYINITLVFFFRAIFIALTIFTIYLMNGVTALTLKNKMIKIGIMIAFIFGIISTAVEINNAMIEEDYPMSFLEIILNYIVYSNIYFFTFVEIVIQSLSMLFIWLLIGRVNDIITLEYVILIIAFVAFQLVKIHVKIHANIKTFNQLRKNETQRVEQESLVSQLLPLHAFEKLKEVGNNNKVELIDVFSDVTLLFADIAGFTKYSAGVKPQDVVKMLKNLFTEFDKICVKHKVYKVYTIGDCYVVMGFLQAKDRDPVREAKNVVKMGLSMIDIIRNVRASINFNDLDMRIGIHTGSVIGGIIGIDIVRYDIYGRDVLIANKMESNGVTGNIMVSETTKKLLEKETSLGYYFEKKKEVECKGLDKPISGFLIYLNEDKHQSNDAV